MIKPYSTKERLMIGYCNMFERTGVARCGDIMAGYINAYWRLLYEQGVYEDLWQVRPMESDVVNGDENPRYECYIIG